MLIIAKLIAGFFIGYGIGSMAEAMIHRYVLHAPRSLVRYWKKHYTFLGFLYREYLIHRIHHQVTQVGAGQKIAELLFGMGEKFALHVIKTKYGLLAQRRGLFYYLIIMSVLFCLPMFLFVDGWVTLGAIPCSCFLPFFMSRYLHPISHNGDEDARRPVLFRYLLRTKYIREVIRYHFIHHAHGSCNYNLILGADYLLGWRKKASAADYQQMEKIGIELK
jgi:hypothetical protein